jgi:CheY-like chemotaxis protein
LTDLSKIESGKLVLAERPFKLAEVRNSTLGLFALAASEKGLRLDFLLDPRLPASVVGDESRLRQVLFNLVGNAVKFTAAGFVRVEAGLISRGEGGSCRAVFCVEDSGAGIPDDRLGDVFEPFVQGEQAYVRRHQGAGLGLAIVKRLVRLMGGSLCLDNAPQGATFCFSIPLRGNPDGVEEGTRFEPEGEGQGSLRVLLVEDDAVSMFATRRVLERAGHAVTPATDGKQAVHLLREGDFDLVLMDVQLPVMDGLQATAVIRGEDFPADKRRVPIVAMTAYAMTGDREKFLAAGMDGYLAKPVGAAELLRALRRRGS